MKTQTEITKTESEMNEILRTVMDPEIELNIVDLGLIYSLRYDGDKKVNIEMTFSTPACPLGDAIIQNVEESIKNKYSDFIVNVNLVFDPHWSVNMISEAGRKKLGC
ncbi:MAG: DUF59 domain-containing protein [Planctomycetia bacterium]|nr:DUF59 domain-containing protein [Planctomycetia bacterium]